MIYVHIPFCRSFCTYCDFYSEVASRCRNKEDKIRQEALFDRFASALVREVRTRNQEISAGNGINTLYIGGGTPSVLPLDVYSRLLDALSQECGRKDFTEFTIEVNPEDIVEKGEAYVEGLLRLGVNRISMGVQSFDDGILKFMNRRHTAGQAVKAYRMLESAGVENISIDLIFGLPQLSDELWAQTLEKALDISAYGRLPKHISSYQLSVEPGSMLARLVEKGLWAEAPDETCERQYSVLCETLASSGYHHYEISNFAQPGFEALHNSSYWRHVPYVGLGPGAHSYNAVDAVRQGNADNLSSYLDEASKGEFFSVQYKEELDEEQLALESVMLGLRTSAGLPEAQLRVSCNSAQIDKALACGDLVRIEDGYLRIPEDRFFISDNVILKIITT